MCMKYQPRTAKFTRWDEGGAGTIRSHMFKYIHTCEHVSLDAHILLSGADT